MNNDSVVSLKNSCLLTILSEIHSYSADTISLLPPRLRGSLLLHAPAVDLYRFGSHDGVWIGVPFDIEDVWKFRYETTLKKYSNVSCLEVDGISWQERYLVSCLFNVPEHRSRTGAPSWPSFGAAFFVTSDIALKDIGIVKLESGSCCHGLISLQSKSRSNTPSSHLISKFYQHKLNSYPLNIPVGADCEFSIYNRIKTMLVLFPDWKPALIPLEYDDHLEEDYDESICTLFVSNVKAVQLLSKHLRSYPYAEVESLVIDVISHPSIGQFCNYMIDLLKNRKSDKCLSRLIVSPPAMKKEVVHHEVDNDEEADSSHVVLTPLSFSTSKLLEWFFEHFPNVNELAVYMHNSHQNCWESSIFHHAKLKNLQLNVIRPTFHFLATIPSTFGFTSIREISLNGLGMTGKDFTGLIISVLNSPNEQQLKLSNIRVNETLNTDEQAIVPQVMKNECRFKTSFHFHRVKGVEYIYSVLTAYAEVWLNDVSVYLANSEKLPFPESTMINCKSLYLERFMLSQDNLDVLSPVLGRTEKVYLSLSDSPYAKADFAIAKICQCIQLCERNLHYLKCGQAYPYVGLNTGHMDQFFSAVFSLPDSTLVNLVFNPSLLINSYAFAMASTVVLQSVHQLKHQTKVDELKHRISGYRLLCQLWKRKNCGFKIKCLIGISEAILNEMEDELLEVCEKLNISESQ